MPKEIGESGLRFFQGSVDEEPHRNLRGRDGVRTYKEMRDNNAVIGAALRVIEDLVRQVSWKAKPADGSDAAQREAEFLTEAMEDMSHTWSAHMTELLSMMVYGWAYFEKVFKARSGGGAGARGRRPKYSSHFDDGRIGWAKFAIRSQDSLDKWEFDENGGIKGMWQLTVNQDHPVLIPIEKSVLYRTEVYKNNPEGRSLLRNAYRSWYFLKRIQEIEAVGVERDLVGLAVVKAPLEFLSADATPKQQAVFNQLQQFVQSLRRNQNEGVVFPAKETDEGITGFDLELLNTGGSRNFDTSDIIVRYEQRIAMTLMTQFMMLGMDRVGSFALSNDQTDLFTAALGSILDNIEETFHRHCTSELMRLNGVPYELWPRWSHGDVRRRSLDEVGNYVMKLTQVQALVPDEPLESHLRRIADLPPIDESRDSSRYNVETPEEPQPEEETAPPGVQDPGTGREDLNSSQE